MTQLDFITQTVDEIAGKTTELSCKIWELAELPYAESGSAQLLCDALAAEGFVLERGMVGMPTAFTATWGNGKPAVGILGEYDALYGLSQKGGSPAKQPLCEGGPGHGCGHNLLGAGSFAAAVAIKRYLEVNKLPGTVVYFGCPAEEGAGSKQFIARAGYFDNIDFAYTWHPATMNEVQSKGSVAIMGANFTFSGTSAHAGGSPHLGRSALDAAELMSVGVNYLREHMIDSARVHYAYSDAGGTSPNVVQDHAVVKYEVRAPKVSQMQELFARVVNIAKGAALMTETKMQYDITMAFSDYLPNKTLATVAQQCFEEVGAPRWSEGDYALATEFLRTYSKSTLKEIRDKLSEDFSPEQVDGLLAKPLHSQILPFNAAEKTYESGSTDVGDVGYATPTLNICVATACVGNVGHTWQNTAFAGSDIGHKGMLTAAKVMALAVLRTMEQPELIAKAKAELLIKNGGKYICPLPENAAPPVGKY